MEIIATVTEKPTVNEYLNLEYTTQDEYNTATSMMMNVFYQSHSDGVCFVTDSKGLLFRLELGHVNWNAQKLSIKVLPRQVEIIERIIPGPSIRNKK